MAIAGAAENTSAAAFGKSSGVQPLLDPFEASEFAFAVHFGAVVKLVKALTFIARPSRLSTNGRASHSTVCGLGVHPNSGIFEIAGKPSEAHQLGGLS